MPIEFPYRRVIVVGTTGAGKSTLAAELAARLGVAHVELDALYWDANWTEAPFEAFRERVAAATRGDEWVADGNYRASRDIVWERAEVLVWLDYGFLTCLFRLLRRTWRRVFTREELWNGNRENIWGQLRLWSKDSLIHWFFKTYWRRKREIPFWLTWPEYEHLKVYHFRSPREMEGWLGGWIVR